MSHTSFHPTDRTYRFAAVTVGALPFVLLLPALLVFFLGSSARVATAQETAGKMTSEVPEDIEVGDGEVSINGGDVYAGNGCAKAGDVVAGDCAGKDEVDGGQEGTPQETTSQETTFQGTTIPVDTSGGSTTIAEETTVLETRSPETTVPVEDGLCPAEPPEDAVEATVERAVDGDTLELADEVGGTDKVRLIGVDTPELEGENGEPKPYAEEAAAFTGDALEGQTVLLQVGEEKTDGYERLLAYVWTSEATEKGVVGGLKRMVGMGGPELFNRTLLEEGYAEVLAVEPNDLYSECFEAAEQRARDEGAGIWGADDGSSDEQYEEETQPQRTTPEMTVEQTLPEEASGSEDAPDEDTAAGQRSVPPSIPAHDTSVPVESYGGEDTVGGPIPTENDTTVDQGSYEPPTRDQYAGGNDEPVPAPEPPAEEPPGEAVPIPEDVGLPTRDTPHGPVAMLPETGGLSPMDLAGVFFICFGAGLLAVTRGRAGAERQG